MMFIDYLKAHPEVVVALVGALYTFATKMRSDEEYEAIAKVSPRLAAFLKLGPALFPDVIKLFRIFKDIKSGKLPPPSGGAE